MPNLFQMRADSSQCRYPVTQQSPWFFCGRETIEGSSYCSRHHKTCVKATVRPVEFLADFINRTDSMSAPSRRNHDRVHPLDEVLK